VGGLFYRLDLLVLLGGHRDGGRGGDYRLRAVLVPGLSDWVASLAVILLLLSLNLATVKMFGEMEFWFAMIKIVAIVALIVVGLVMVLMHFSRRPAFRPLYPSVE
jgi:amino acid transporter